MECGREMADHGRGAEDKGRLAGLRRIGADVRLYAALQALSEIV